MLQTWNVPTLWKSGDTRRRFVSIPRPRASDRGEGNVFPPTVLLVQTFLTHPSFPSSSTPLANFPRDALKRTLKKKKKKKRREREGGGVTLRARVALIEESEERGRREGGRESDTRPFIPVNATFTCIMPATVVMRLPRQPWKNYATV